MYAALDARMGEVYWAEYQVKDKQLIAVGNEAVIAPDKVVSSSSNRAVAIGHGWSSYGDILAKQVSASIEKVEADKLPRAIEVVRLAKEMLIKGDIVSAENALPVYLRDNVAKKKQVKV